MAPRARSADCRVADRPGRDRHQADYPPGADALGTCPHCGRSISRASHLISYRNGGWPTMFARCDGCDEVVHPV